jgi:hypothetical protein
VEPSEIFGMFDSGGSDVARDKDRYIDDAVTSTHARD